MYLVIELCNDGDMDASFHKKRTKKQAREYLEAEEYDTFYELEDHVKAEKDHHTAYIYKI